MDSADLSPEIADLRDNVDNLEIALAPLLRADLAEITSKLPLLDKAKLSVLTTYAIESILFSLLKLNGVDAKSHPVFHELARVRQYFAKINDAETQQGSVKRKLDSQAANRFIKNALNGNEKIDRERAARLAEERNNAKRRLGELSGQQQPPKRLKVKGRSEAPSSSSSSDLGGGNSSSVSLAGAQSISLKPAPTESASTSTGSGAHQDQQPHFTEVKNGEPLVGSSSASERKVSRARKLKSGKVPRDSKAVLVDLLSRGGASHVAV